jgi:serine phosphatase RsbU (regulator of sigma subunit)
VHLVSSCANGRISRVLLADVSGHGEAAEARADDLRRIMRRFANHLAPDGFLQQVSGVFEQSSAAHEFATAVVATFLASDRGLTIAHAGHPPSLFFEAQRRRWSSLAGDDEEDNLPLGLDPSGRYSRHERRMAQGDMVLYYSDAWIEASKADGGALGVEGFRGLVEEVDVRAPETFFPRLRTAFAESVGGVPEQDDATLVLMRATGRGPRWRDRLLSTPRTLGALLASLRPGGPPMPWPAW